jgi:hypothetical protein
MSLGADLGAQLWSEWFRMPIYYANTSKAR